MFKAIVLAAVLALAAAAPAPGVVASYSGVVSPAVASYSAIPAISTYGASPVVSSYGSYGTYGAYGVQPIVQPAGYSSYGYGVPVTYY